MSKLLPATTAALVVAAAALLVPLDAGATIVQNAAGSCQAARSSYAPSLRVRPTGISNEGTASVYLSCSLSSPDYYRSANDVNGVVLANPGAADVTVSCTLAAGSYENLPATFYPKSITVPAGGSPVTLSWSAATDNAGVLFANTMNYSCILPPGIDLQTVFTNGVAIPDNAAAP